MAKPDLPGSPCCIPVELCSFPVAGAYAACHKALYLAEQRNSRCAVLRHAWPVCCRVRAQKKARREAALQGIFIVFYYTYIFRKMSSWPLGESGVGRVSPKGAVPGCMLLSRQTGVVRRRVCRKGVLPQAALSHMCTQQRVLRGADRQ